MLTTMPAVVVVVVLVAQAQQQAPPQAPEGQVGDHPEKRNLAVPAGAYTFVDGNKLWVSCSPTRKAECYAYIAGASDMMNIFSAVIGVQKVCVPPQAPEGQVGDVVIKYLTDHPEQRRHAAAALVFSALKGAFPCPTK